MSTTKKCPSCPFSTSLKFALTMPQREDQQPMRKKSRDCLYSIKDKKESRYVWHIQIKTAGTFTTPSKIKKKHPPGHQEEWGNIGLGVKRNEFSSSFLLTWSVVQSKPYMTRQLSWPVSSPEEYWILTGWFLSSFAHHEHPGFQHDATVSTDVIHTAGTAIQ